MSSGPSQATVLDSARDLVGRSGGQRSGGQGGGGQGGGGDWGGSWSRAAAFLTRSALEDAVAARWEALSLGPLAACPQSTQLLCLPAFLDDEVLARDVHATWAQLSNACHAHSYELAPTVDELRRWIDVVQRLITSAPPS